MKRIIEALDSDSLSLHDQIGRAHRAITPQPQLTASTEIRAEAAAQVDELIRSRGWTVDPDAPALTTLIETVAAFRTLDQDHLAGFLDSYADAVEKFTELEVAAVTSRADRTTPDQIAESVVIGTILGETLISTLRLLAQESISARRWKVD